MNTKYKVSAIVACFTLLMASCGERNTQAASKTIDVETAMANQTELKASDCFRKIRYIPLETTDSCLVGRNPKVQLFADKILLTTFQNQCLLFDQSGRFLCSVGHVGEDPEGYAQVGNWVNEQAGTVYFPGWNNNLIAYNTDGTFKETVRLPEEAKGMMNCFEFPGDGRLVQYASGLFNDKDYIQFYKNGEAVRTIKSIYPDSSSFNPGMIESISVLKSEEATKYFAPGGMETIIQIQLKDPDKALVSISGTTHLWRVGNDVFYKATYNDTIYHVVDTTLVPAHVFNLGKHHWEYADRFDKNRKDAILMSHILDSKDYMLFRFTTDVHDKIKSYNALLNKSTGELKVGDCSAGLQDDLTRFMPLQPLAVSPSGEYAGLLAADQVVSWFEEHASTQDISKEMEVLRAVGEEDNPVIVIME